MRILFLCMANSVRSQMAEGLARGVLGDDVEILSAGLQPSYVHPTAIMAMAELGIDISMQHSKAIDDIPLYEIDYIITLCADNICPMVPETIIQEHWMIAEPGGGFDGYRAIRDDLQTRILDFKKRLAAY